MKYIYHSCDKILVSSKGFIQSIASKGVDRDKIDFFPQWAEPVFKPVKRNFKLLPKNIPKNSFKIMFAGNIGESQDFPAILESAKMLKSKKKILVFMKFEKINLPYVPDRCLDFFVVLVVS